MIPGNIYLGLMVGGNLGAAAEWVTIILFAEITKRSFTTLKKQEVYVLYYVAAGLIAAETGSFQGLLWNQYLRQSPAANNTLQPALAVYYRCTYIGLQAVKVNGTTSFVHIRSAEVLASPV